MTEIADVLQQMREVGDRRDVVLRAMAQAQRAKQGAEVDRLLDEDRELSRAARALSRQLRDLSEGQQ